MKLEIKIEPNSDSLLYYSIYYRPKRRFNLFNPWNQLVEVWDGANLSYDQPVLFDNFDKAVEYGNQLKSNPKLIKEHYDREDKKYNESKKKRDEYYDTRNKKTII